MKKKLLALALLSTFAAPAVAAMDEGVYLVGLLGNTSNISNAEKGSSFAGLIGYQFSPLFSVEFGMTSLVDKANYLTPKTPGYGGVGSYTSTSLAGSEFAAVIGVPLNEDFSILVRLGFASMERKDNPSPAEVETSWKGSVYGLGAQYMLPYEFGFNGGKLKIGLRAGFSKYNLKDPTGLLTETPTNTHIGGVILF
jgi:hypothetical protein